MTPAGAAARELRSISSASSSVARSLSCRVAQRYEYWGTNLTAGMSLVVPFVCPVLDAQTRQKRQKDCDELHFPHIRLLCG